MLKYKNISSYPLTFYNITFNPNEVKEVPGYVNHPKMIRITEPVSSKPKSVIEIAEPKAKIEPKPDAEVKPKRHYTKRNSNK